MEVGIGWAGSVTVTAWRYAQAGNGQILSIINQAYTDHTSNVAPLRRIKRRRRKKRKKKKRIHMKKKEERTK